MEFRSDVGREIKLRHAVEKDRAPGKEQNCDEGVFVALRVVFRIHVHFSLVVIGAALVFVVTVVLISATTCKAPALRRAIAAGNCSASLDWKRAARARRR